MFFRNFLARASYESVKIILNIWNPVYVSGNTEKVSVAELMKNNDIDMIREIIYPHREDFKLILTKAEGTRYENFLHDMVNEDQKEMLKVLDFLKSRGNKVVEVSEKEMHTILSAAYTAMLEPVIHDYTQSETEHCLSVVEEFFMPGWQKLMGF